VNLAQWLAATRPPRSKNGDLHRSQPSHHHPTRHADALGKLREQLDGSPSPLGQGVDYALQAILHRIVDQYLPIFGMIEGGVLAMEKPSMDNFLERREVDQIFALRGERIRFQRTLGGKAELVRKLVRGHFPCISPEVGCTSMMWRFTSAGRRPAACPVDGVRSQQHVGGATDGLGHAATRGLGAILAVPTAIAVIYGMNFKNMPELDTPHGYFVVRGLIALSCVALFRRFKNAKWLQARAALPGADRTATREIGQYL